MADCNLTLGRYAIVSIDLHYVHPSEYIRDKYPNRKTGDRLENCRITGLEEVKVNKRMQLVATFHHDDFKTNDEFIKLYTVKRWAKVVVEGPRDFFFTSPVNEQQRAERVQEVEAAAVPLPAAVTEAILRGRVDHLDVADLAAVIDIDDDNAPAPENIPTINTGVAEVEYEDWGHSGICYRRERGPPNMGARINGIGPDVVPTYLQLFEILFPVNFVKTVMIPMMNASGELEPELKYGEFIKWLGLWFLMATTSVQNRRSFWSVKPPDNFDITQLRFNEYMSRNRFENIRAALSFTNVEPPTYLDRFWEVRQLLDEWNTNMDRKFQPSWISCVDESMSKWVGQFTCPGFIVCPRKPWPFGNEYHTISCGETNIIYRQDLIEGKDEPRQRQAKSYSELGKTIGTVMRLCQPIFGSSRIVVADSGFCILKAIVELRKKGVYMSALIKKR